MSGHDQENAQPPVLALLQRGVRWFSDELVVRLAEAGVDPITPSHIVVLSQIDDRTPLSIAELARRAGVTRQTMHRAVTQLVDEGLLTSTPGPGFPRSSLVELTAAGRRRRTVAAGILRDLELVLADRLGTAAVSDLRDSLARAWPNSSGQAD